MIERADGETLSQRLSQIGKRFPGTKVNASTNPGTENQERNVLTRMVCAGGSRIVAMIGGDDQQIVSADAWQQRGQPGIETLEVRSVTRRVVAVPINRVEIDEIREYQAGRRRIERAFDFVHAVGVTRRVDRLGNAAAGEQILDLADGEHVCPASFSKSRRVGANGVSAKS